MHWSKHDDDHFLIFPQCFSAFQRLSPSLDKHFCLQFSPFWPVYYNTVNSFHNFATKVESDKEYIACSGLKSSKLIHH